MQYEGEMEWGSTRYYGTGQRGIEFNLYDVEEEADTIWYKTSASIAQTNMFDFGDFCRFCIETGFADFHTFFEI